jgi:hypothetical protein
MGLMGGKAKPGGTKDMRLKENRKLRGSKATKKGGKK